jgi:regulator of sirC expression with transglutaminase-like and TPR domain
MRHSSKFIDPTACRPEAFEHLRSHLGQLNSTRGLVQCALAAAMHPFDDCQPQQVWAELERLSEMVRRRCRSGHPTAMIAHLHQVLFEEAGYRGAPPSQYGHPINSFLPAVLTARRGLPILLALVYKAVAEPLGLEVQGIRSRGHFLVRVKDSSGWLIVDPYHGGRAMNVTEACGLISGLLGEPPQIGLAQLPTATHHEWLTRIFVNLVYAFDMMGRAHDRTAMREMLELVRSWRSVSSGPSS